MGCRKLGMNQRAPATAICVYFRQVQDAFSSPWLLSRALGTRIVVFGSFFRGTRQLIAVAVLILFDVWITPPSVISATAGNVLYDCPFIEIGFALAVKRVVSQCTTRKSDAPDTEVKRSFDPDPPNCLACGMGLLSILFTRRDKAPPSLSFELDARDDAAEMIVSTRAEPDFALAGMRVGIAYKDERGSRSKRVIRVRRLDAGEYVSYLHAFCELRKDERTFRLDRIDILYDPSTGEILGNPDQFFGPYIERSLLEEERTTEKSRFRRAWVAIEALRDELAVLILVARADGRFVKAEQNMMLKYASERAKELDIELNDEGLVVLLNWIKTQDPSEPEARIAVRNLARRPDALESIWEVSELIAEADGKVREQEVTAFREVRAAIESIVAEEARETRY